MTEDEILFTKACVDENRVHDFYTWSKWLKKRQEILQKDRRECQICKQKGKYRRAVIVHHVMHLRNRPDLALCDTYTDENGVQHRQLISVCRDCHETVCHPERLRRHSQRKKFLIEERWD